MVSVAEMTDGSGGAKIINTNKENIIGKTSDLDNGKSHPLGW